MRVGELFIFTALLWSSAVYSTLLTDVFKLKRGASEGGCTNKQTVLNQWMTDTNTLVTAVLDGMPANPASLTDQNMKNNLASYFGIGFGKGGDGPIDKQSVAAYRSVRDYVDSVDKFLKRKDRDFLGTKKPWLFCGSRWLQETEILYNENTGKPVKDPKTGKDANMRTYKPATLKKLPAGNPLKSLLTMMQRGKPNWAYYAYWSKDIKDYDVVPKSKKSLGRPASFCNTPRGETLFALSITKLLADTITLCPPAFLVKAEPFETIANALASPKVDKAGTPIGEVSPRGLTLFHEIFHLVKPDKLSTDSATKSTQCLGLIKSGKAAAARINPDNYVNFAWSYYLTDQNPRFFWHTGFSVLDPNAMDTSKRAALLESVDTDDEVIVARDPKGSKPKPPKSNNPPAKTSAAPPKSDNPPASQTPKSTPPKSNPPPASQTSKSAPPSATSKVAITSATKISTLASSKTTKTSSIASTSSAEPNLNNIIKAAVIIDAAPIFANWQTTDDFNLAEAKAVAAAIDSMILTGNFPTLSWGNSTTNGTTNGTEPVPHNTTQPVSLGTQVPTEPGSIGTAVPTGSAGTELLTSTAIVDSTKTGNCTTAAPTSIATFTSTKKWNGTTTAPLTTIVPTTILTTTKRCNGTTAA